jgi:hypothetical protein
MPLSTELFKSVDVVKDFDVLGVVTGIGIFQLVMSLYEYVNRFHNFSSGLPIFLVYLDGHGHYCTLVTCI